MAELVKAALYEQLANQIRDNITSGTWEPGRKLPSEGTLRDDYGVSIATVRRALVLLKEEGLITVQNGVGSHVSTSYGQAPVTIERNRTTQGPTLTAITPGVAYRGQAPTATAALLGIDADEPLFIIETTAAEDGTGRRVLIRRMIPISASTGRAPDPDADSATLLAAQTAQHGKTTTTEYLRAYLPSRQEREALGIADVAPIIETVRVETARGRCIYAETQRTSADGIQLAYRIN